MKTYGKHALQVRVLSDRTLRFCYDASPEMRFEVSLFCEIGEPFKSSFTTLMHKSGLTIAKEPRELAARPYLADCLFP